jgi:hypothetical protein
MVTATVIPWGTKASTALWKAFGHFYYCLLRPRHHSYRFLAVFDCDEGEKWLEGLPQLVSGLNLARSWPQQQKGSCIAPVLIIDVSWSPFYSLWAANKEQQCQRSGE